MMEYICRLNRMNKAGAKIIELRTEELYKMIYENYVEQKLREGNNYIL